MPARRAAVITGASRGIGAATARELAERGFDIAFTYRNKGSRAADVAALVRRAGGEALAVQADITDAAAMSRFAAEAGTWRPALDLLVLNASGGLERDLLAADPGYPMRINRDAQVAAIEKLLPRLARGATIVFVTSHWAHRYGSVPQLPDYEPIAESKHAGENALRARIDELGERGIRLLVVSGDLVLGSITARLLERRARGLGDARAEESVTAEEFARAIADAALDPALATGETIVVGGALGSLPR